MTTANPSTPRNTRTTLWFLLVIAAGLALGIAWFQQQNSQSITTSQVPESLRDEPDLRIEDAVIHQYRQDGSLKYLLLAAVIKHFDYGDETGEVTRMTQPNLRLATQSGEPWQATADHGDVTSEALSPATDPTSDTLPSGARARGKEEVVVLRDNVELVQQLQPPRLLSVRTSKLWLYPDREFVETNESVTIDTHTGRTTASAMHGDLATGVLTLTGTTRQVQTIVLPFQFKKTPPAG